MFSRYTCRAITGLYWHAMGGIIMYRIREEPTDQDITFCFVDKSLSCHENYNIEKQTNIVIHESMPCHLLIKNKDHFFFW